MAGADRSTGAALYRLLAWLSANFPTGAFSYSHGLEAAAAAGVVRDRASLEAWVAAILEHGSGRIDADILCNAYRAAAAGDVLALAQTNQRGIAYRATAELALESTQQGAAFLAAYDAAWVTALASDPHPSPPPLAGEGDRRVSGGRVGAFAEDVCHSAAFGVAVARAGIALDDALVGYLQAFAANLIAAGLRLGLVGQTDGQRILAALEPVVARAAAAAMTREAADFGSATFAADLLSIAHETQYSRLFRS
jgi:urease accessory protein